jgi:hypothetical protein
MTKVMDQFEKEVENLGAYPILHDARRTQAWLGGRHA